jgi:hypothetical protein
VIGGAASTAQQLAVANVNDGSVAVGTPVFTASTVRVTATSDQVGFFSRLFGVDSTSLSASAKAQWSQPITPLPLAYHECALPAPSASTVFLRYDLLDLNLGSCGLLSGVTDLLGPGWVATSDCKYTVDLLSYVSSTLTKVLPTQCAALVSSLIGKQVMLPVYSRILGPIVINGALLGNGYQVEKYAVMTVTGYDFQTLNLSVFGAVTATIGPKSMPGAPQCPSVDVAFVHVEMPTCQGLQGVFSGYLTPAEAAQRLVGVQLIE